jgi:hypothetical protein
MCLLGVDYFSTLAYQPSTTYEVAGPLGPLATVVVVLVTLCGALPVYLHVAGRSPFGQGSISLLERLVRGWRGKTSVLLLLGFAATDFVMIKTISLADAAEHVIRNEFPPWQDALQSLADSSRGLGGNFLGELFLDFFNKQLVVTILLTVVGFGFWAVIRRGFNNKVVLVAVPIVGVFLLLNAVVIGSGLVYLANHPERLVAWFDQVRTGDYQLERPLTGNDGWTIALLCLLFFPQLSLGLSGFEMSMVLMPQIKGDPGDDPARPAGRVRNTRKVLVLAAAIMSVYLLGSVLVTTTLIDPRALQPPHGPATNRALAYLAHGGLLADGRTAAAANPLFGTLFGSVYDLSTVLLLCLAGTSVMTALQTLLPRFLLRFGMELKWAHKWGVLFILFALINLAVTLWFRASVSAQRGAYATGVLALIFNACAVTAIDRWRHGSGPWLVRFPWGYALIAGAFFLTAAAVVVMYPSGLLIAFGFIVTILGTSVFSRAVRTGELRTTGLVFADEQSRFLWECLKAAEFPVLVPHRPGRHERELKEQSIRRDHQLAPDADFVFLEVEVDDPSNFYQTLLIEVVREGNRFVIKARRCVSVAHAIAAIALELSQAGKPPGLHFGWSEMDLLEASWSYLAFGEGNVPWRVRELIQRAEPNPERQPRVIIG